MAIYLQKTTEENLYLCILHNVWGAYKNTMAHWKQGDTCIAYVGEGLAAVFAIESETFYDDTPLWPDTLYPNRINISLVNIIHPSNRYSMKSDDIREAMVTHHEHAWGISIVLAKKALTEEAANVLLNHIEESPLWTEFDVARELELLRESQTAEYEANAEALIVDVTKPDEIVAEEFSHTEIQYYLATLGLNIGYEIWIPKSDQGKEFNGIQLGKLSLSNLPQLPFNNYVQNIIKNIDVIWLERGNPLHLFEVERTTSIYSGLLRMSDLVALFPKIGIRMYICASQERNGKVVAEVTRPTFDRLPIPLAELCYFIAFEELVELMGSEDKLLRHVGESVLELVAHSIRRPEPLD